MQTMRVVEKTLTLVYLGGADRVHYLRDGLTVFPPCPCSAASTLGLKMNLGQRTDKRSFCYIQIILRVV
jgi:hypothetical protein